MNRNPTTARTRVAALLVAIGLMAAACGSDDPAEAGSSTTESTDAMEDDAMEDDAMEDDAMEDDAMEDEAMDEGEVVTVTIENRMAKPMANAMI